MLRAILAASIDRARDKTGVTLRPTAFTLSTCFDISWALHPDAVHAVMRNFPRAAKARLDDQIVYSPRIYLGAGAPFSDDRSRLSLAGKTRELTIVGKMLPQSATQRCVKYKIKHLRTNTWLGRRNKGDRRRDGNQLDFPPPKNRSVSELASFLGCC